MRKFIEEIAREAGRIAVEGGRHLTSGQIHVKATPTDMVTEIDRRVEEFLVEAIRRRYPEHGIFGEETGRTAGDSDWCWVIDPIDGTTSFIHGFPYYSISIACRKAGRTEAGVVYAPRLGELFSAERGGGARLNGEAIHVSACTELKSALMATGFACVRAGIRPDNLDLMPELVRSIQGVRRCGSAALDLCNVAAGRFDGYWEWGLQLYDIAAGVLILEEAGGRITDYSGGEAYPEKGVAATNGPLHEKLLPFLNRRP